MSDYFDKNSYEIFKNGQIKKRKMKNEFAKNFDLKKLVLTIDSRGWNLIYLEEVDQSKYFEYKSDIYLSDFLYVISKNYEKLKEEFKGKECLLIDIKNKLISYILEFISSSSANNTSLLRNLNELYHHLLEI